MFTNTVDDTITVTQSLTVADKIARPRTCTIARCENAVYRSLRLNGTCRRKARVPSPD